MDGREQRRGAAASAAEDAGAGSLAAGTLFAGLRVLEFGSGAAGPIATRYFAEQGATVVRVESRQRPDFLRVLHRRDDDPSSVDRAPMFALLNADKLSVAINLATPEGGALARDLALWADVVAENFAPGVMARWGLDAESLLRRKSDLVVVSGCLFGQTGPQRGYPGFGGQGSAISGFNHVTGYPDGDALGPYGTITDSLAPRFVATLVTAALLERRRTGQGQIIDLSQIETGAYCLSETIVRRSAGAGVRTRDANAHEHVAPHGIYPCRGDDRWIAVAVRGDDEWTALRRMMGDPGWAREEGFATAAGRVARRDELDGLLGSWTADFDPYQLMDLLQAAGVEAGVVQNLDDLRADPQLASRDHFVPLEHRHLGEMPFERSALRFDGRPGRLERSAPDLGEHTEAVLREVLGLDRSEIARLRKSGVLS